MNVIGVEQFPFPGVAPESFFLGAGNCRPSEIIVGKGAAHIQKQSKFGLMLEGRFLGMLECLREGEKAKGGRGPTAHNEGEEDGGRRAVVCDVGPPTQAAFVIGSGQKDFAALARFPVQGRLLVGIGGSCADAARAGGVDWSCLA